MTRIVKPKAGQAEPGSRKAGMPTIPTPTKTGRQYQGPATSPSRSDAGMSRMMSSTTRLPWPEWPSLLERLSLLPRGASRCRIIANVRGSASEPITRNEPEPPIIVPSRKGVEGIRTAFPAGEAGCGGSGRFLRAAVAGARKRSLSVGAHEGPFPGRMNPYRPSLRFVIWTIPIAALSKKHATARPQTR
jgi:hypothetical protein